MPAYRRALTIAGSDSGGGAGLQADLKSFAALGCFGLSAITAVTAQNTRGVQSVEALPAALVSAQIDSVASDIGVDAVKIGMLANAEIVITVAEAIRRHGLAPVVLDPVMIASSGARLLDEAAVETLREQLMPLAALVTPNLPEAEALLGRTLANRAEIERGAKDLLATGAGAVLIKGGHAAGERAEDCLVRQDGATEWLSAARVATGNNHGTGCTLSAAIAAGLAHGKDLPSAVHAAKDYVTAALTAGAGYRFGSGSGPLHHFFAFWR